MSKKTDAIGDKRAPPGSTRLNSVKPLCTPLSANEKNSHTITYPPIKLESTKLARGLFNTISPKALNIGNKVGSIIARTIRAHIAARSGQLIEVWRAAAKFELKALVEMATLPSLRMKSQAQESSIKVKNKIQKLSRTNEDKSKRLAGFLRIILDTLIYPRVLSR